MRRGFSSSPTAAAAGAPPNSGSTHRQSAVVVHLPPVWPILLQLKVGPSSGQQLGGWENATRNLTLTQIDPNPTSQWISPPPLLRVPRRLPPHGSGSSPPPSCPSGQAPTVTQTGPIVGTCFWLARLLGGPSGPLYGLVPAFPIPFPIVWFGSLRCLIFCVTKNLPKYLNRSLCHDFPRFLALSRLRCWCCFVVLCRSSRDVFVSMIRAFCNFPMFCVSSDLKLTADGLGFKYQPLPVWFLKLSQSLAQQRMNNFQT